MIPHVVEIPEADLDDLRARLANIRDGYDWRTHEARLNQHPQFTTRLDGQVKESHLVVIGTDPDEALPEAREASRSIPPFTCEY